MVNVEGRISAIKNEELFKETGSGWLQAIVGKNGKVLWMPPETLDFFGKDEVQSTFDIIPDSGNLLKVNVEAEGKAMRSWMKAKLGSRSTWIRIEGYPMHGLRYVRAQVEEDSEQQYEHVEEISSVEQ